MQICRRDPVHRQSRGAARYRTSRLWLEAVGSGPQQRARPRRSRKLLRGGRDRSAPPSARGRHELSDARADASDRAGSATGSSCGLREREASSFSARKLQPVAATTGMSAGRQHVRRARYSPERPPADSGCGAHAQVLRLPQLSKSRVSPSLHSATQRETATERSLPSHDYSSTDQNHA